MAPKRKSGAKPLAIADHADAPADAVVDGPVTFVTEDLELLLVSN